MTPSTALVMISPRIFPSIRKPSSCSTILRGNNQPMFSGYGGLLIDGARDKSREKLMPTTRDREQRQSIIDACVRMNALGINQGTSGNISLRHDEGMLITPT